MSLSYEVISSNFEFSDIWFGFGLCANNDNFNPVNYVAANACFPFYSYGGSGQGLSSPIVVDTADDPIPVTVIEDEVSFPSVYSSGDPLDIQIEDVPPDNPPFYGSLYITGETSSGQTVTLYFPTTYKEGYFGVDSSGRLFNVSASSITGYYSGAYNNSINLPAWSYPRYRTSSSSYDYTDLYIVPQYSNIDIATGMEGRTTFTDLVPYFSLLMLGVIYLCCLKRS